MKEYFTILAPGFTVLTPRAELKIEHFRELIFWGTSKNSFSVRGSHIRVCVTFTIVYCTKYINNSNFIQNNQSTNQKMKRWNESMKNAPVPDVF